MTSGVEQLIGRVVTDTSFLNALIANPEGTISAAGLSLTAAEIAKLSEAVAQTTLDKKSIPTHVSTKGVW